MSHPAAHPLEWRQCIVATPTQVMQTRTRTPPTPAHRWLAAAHSLMRSAAKHTAPRASSSAAWMYTHRRVNRMSRNVDTWKQRTPTIQGSLHSTCVRACMDTATARGVPCPDSRKGRYRCMRGQLRNTPLRTQLRPVAHVRQDCPDPAPARVFLHSAVGENPATMAVDQTQIDSVTSLPGALIGVRMTEHTHNPPPGPVIPGSIPLKCDVPDITTPKSNRTCY